MECRTLDLTLISAKRLKNVSLFGKMDVYAVVFISGTFHSISGTFQKLKTPVNKGGGPNPTWNFPMKFIVDESTAMNNRLTLVVKIKSVGMFGMFVNRQLGEVHVPIKELMESMKSDVKSMQFVSYRVRRPSGKTTKGELNFSYKFGEKFSITAEEPVTANPPARAARYLSYPPPPPPRPMNSRTGLLGGALRRMLRACCLVVVEVVAHVVALAVVAGVMWVVAEAVEAVDRRY
ncbi:hypothetical protein OSB04_un000898 [Centaurea solstitialis]|uniref:C2 domain-containing protein n=1 Tax=Centaurea solstitialis TaxID=347529 RepID=A0AA38SGT5_9ASTR|nr:hypothetical protein OSB04_un000898 [Centaurea solstitialis]